MTNVSLCYSRLAAVGIAVLAGLIMRDARARRMFAERRMTSEMVHRLRRLKVANQQQKSRFEAARVSAHVDVCAVNRADDWVYELSEVARQLGDLHQILSLLHQNPSWKRLLQNCIGKLQDLELGILRDEPLEVRYDAKVPVQVKLIQNKHLADPTMLAGGGSPSQSLEATVGSGVAPPGRSTSVSGTAAGSASPGGSRREYYQDSSLKVIRMPRKLSLCRRFDPNPTHGSLAAIYDVDPSIKLQRILKQATMHPDFLANYFQEEIVIELIEALREKHYAALGIAPSDHYQPEMSPFEINVGSDEDNSGARGSPPRRSESEKSPSHTAHESKSPSNEKSFRRSITDAVRKRGPTASKSLSSAKELDHPSPHATSSATCYVGIHLTKEEALRFSAVEDSTNGTRFQHLQQIRAGNGGDAGESARLGQIWASLSTIDFSMENVLLHTEQCEGPWQFFVDFALRFWHTFAGSPESLLGRHPQRFFLELAPLLKGKDPFMRTAPGPALSSDQRNLLKNFDPNPSTVLLENEGWLTPSKASVLESIPIRNCDSAAAGLYLLRHADGWLRVSDVVRLGYLVASLSYGGAPLAEVLSFLIRKFVLGVEAGAGRYGRQDSFAFGGGVGSPSSASAGAGTGRESAFTLDRPGGTTSDSSPTSIVPSSTSAAKPAPVPPSSAPGTPSAARTTPLLKKDQIVALRRIVIELLLTSEERTHYPDLLQLQNRLQDEAFDIWSREADTWLFLKLVFRASRLNFCFRRDFTTHERHARFFYRYTFLHAITEYELVNSRLGENDAELRPLLPAIQRGVNTQIYASEMSSLLEYIALPLLHSVSEAATASVRFGGFRADGPRYYSRAASGVMVGGSIAEDGLEASNEYVRACKRNLRKWSKIMVKKGEFFCMDSEDLEHGLLFGPEVGCGTGRTEMVFYVSEEPCVEVEIVRYPPRRYRGRGRRSVIGAVHDHRDLKSQISLVPGAGDPSGRAGQYGRVWGWGEREQRQ